MGEFFNRSFVLNAGGTRIASESVDRARSLPFRLTFEISRDLAKQANTAKFTVYNLSEDRRAAFASKGIQATFEAGYSDRISLLFSGELEAAKNQRQGADWLTGWEGTDSGDALRRGRINKSFNNPTARALIEACAESIGVNIGNAIDKAKKGNIRGAITEFSQGLVLSGPTKKQLDKVAASFGYDWSIQNGELQLLERGEAIKPGEVVLLSGNSGLIGTPESGEDGVVAAVSLLQPGLEPGRRVRIESGSIDGFYRIEKTVYSGDTYSNEPWFAAIEGKPL